MLVVTRSTSACYPVLVLYCRQQWVTSYDGLLPFLHMLCSCSLLCDAMQARPMPSCGVRLFVRPSVTFVNSVKTTNRIFKIFSPSGSQTILVFRTKRHGNIPTGTSLAGASNARRMKKSRFFDQYLALSRKLYQELLWKARKPHISFRMVPV